MNGYKKLWYGGYGKYNYYVVAGDKDEALEALRDKYNMRALPVDCKEINNIDGHIIIPVLESELNDTEEDTDEKTDKSPAGTPETFGIKIDVSQDASTLSRAELIQLAKELNIDGKIATFKTEELKKKVGEKLGATEKESGASN